MIRKDCTAQKSDDIQELLLPTSSPHFYFARTYESALKYELKTCQDRPSFLSNTFSNVAAENKVEQLIILSMRGFFIHKAILDRRRGKERKKNVFNFSNLAFKTRDHCYHYFLRFFTN
jgi:hypothetical protein